MQAIKFKLTGRTAFFKKPDVNVNTYFTYNNIHKVALLGILGAVIGLQGHIQQNRSIKEGNSVEYPEFYSKLKDLKICINPYGKNGYFSKKVQIFNNSVGYASGEAGGNLIVREQWIENPLWEIYLLNDGSIEQALFDKLEDYLIHTKCTYIPYLGKNDHPAVIEDCKIVNLEEVKDIEHIDSLFLVETVTLGDSPYIEGGDTYFFKEFSPVSLSKQYNFYEFRELCYTSLLIEEVATNDSIYKEEGKIIAFF
ncbi:MULTISPECIES: type I-B CRISPR-associated protein Cas5b [Clostridium]|uniref:type I-B CRISPR-associated protein Cas5b n=1 Tax=Clostridium TaxID=1485 RepID=UPI0013E96D8F|nr:MULTISPECIES: type I-B CRISPR-associated protein Cas5b [Clostridium]MBW9159616.1 type I-B CRISPR-associated protein Cas5b [Clostridium tagluense]MBZ9634181.1 type I-B CRISPR-associated protein Cas5b [Clostridium sp. FP1]WLC66919.1 type I-B CRISPR-associated protein Cas5b [Clostridium tagluense]